MLAQATVKMKTNEPVDIYLALYVLLLLGDESRHLCWKHIVKSWTYFSLPSQP